MPKEKVKKRLGDIRFKTGGEAVRRSASTRKLSVRKLENFESVREQFEQLMMLIRLAAVLLQKQLKEALLVLLNLGKPLQRFYWTGRSH